MSLGVASAQNTSFHLGHKSEEFLLIYSKGAIIGAEWIQNR